jgi:hypothetical protein
MLRKIILTAVLVAVVAVGLFVGVNRAHAATFTPQSASATGVSATCSLQTWATLIHDDTTQIDCQLADTLDDGYSVYVKWWLDGFGPVVLYNRLGSGNTVPVSDARYNGAGSFGTAYFQVCRDILLSPLNNCSDTKSWLISA